MVMNCVHEGDKHVQLDTAMAGKSCLLEKAGSKRHANYTSDYLDRWLNDCMRIDGEPRYAVMLSAILQQRCCVSLGILSQ